jgi:hypothetical protein
MVLDFLLNNQWVTATLFVGAVVAIIHVTNRSPNDGYKE